jgi:hypothetical protein
LRPCPSCFPRPPWPQQLRLVQLLQNAPYFLYASLMETP